ncbi:disulfide bond formation protein B [Psychrobacter sp. FDAARGOS_221]|uniref:disulfide bond formation protein B n=1 Tax=Psychrobacter sp. FDAARGOS_221 TaxID=1975705 RepID=UPI000BB55B14|nr:disulfide bond formation protein B [Psychrobacter sp. FDAARGOS_221]PNK60825.1 disulfide bond formation protein B [Psychrobacter sp. FDAARGOS_221]
MQRILTYRTLNLLLVFFSVVGMAFAVFYLQMYKGLEPCPLCIFQRVGLMVMGAFAFISAVFNPKKLVARLILWIGSMAGIVWSVGVAARHVWIQNLPPDQVPACGPGLDYWLEALPMKQVIDQVLAGSGECAEISWKFLGLTIPEQGLIFFSALILINLVLFWRIVKQRA